MRASPTYPTGFDQGAESLGIAPAKMTTAVVLSLVLHLLGYLWWGMHLDALAPLLDDRARPRAPVRVSLVAAQPAAPAPVVPVPAVTVPKPAPHAVPQVQPKSKPLRAAPRRESVPRVPAVSAPLARPVAATHAVAAATASVPMSASSAGPSAEALRERYLRDLFAHIERFKFYPAAARRQGMEASIRVGFLLDRSGAVRGLDIDGGPKLLRHAAEETLSRAAPLPELPPGLTAPMRVDFRMSFALR